MVGIAAGLPRRARRCRRRRPLWSRERGFPRADQILSFRPWLAARLPVVDALALVHALEEALALPLRPFLERLRSPRRGLLRPRRPAREARHRDAMRKRSSAACCIGLPVCSFVGHRNASLDERAGRLLIWLIASPAFVVEGSAL